MYGIYGFQIFLNQLCLSCKMLTIFLMGPDPSILILVAGILTIDNFYALAMDIFASYVYRI